MELVEAGYAERDRLVVNHLGLVKKVAVGLVRRLPAQVEMNELIGEGVVGLLDAARRYKPASGVPFEAFAARRVRGSMLDALRAVDTASRRTRRLERGMKVAKTGLRQRLGRDPHDTEVADAMGLSRQAFARAPPPGRARRVDGLRHLRGGVRRRPARPREGDWLRRGRAGRRARAHRSARPARARRSPSSPSVSARCSPSTTRKS